MSDSEVKFEFTYILEDETGKAHNPTEEVSFVSDTNDFTSADGRAFKEFADKFGIDPVSKVRKEWKIKKRKISFYNPPWEKDGHDLTDDIMSINDVVSVRYQSPYEFGSEYGPPKLHVWVTPGTINTVKNDILSYYGGLVVEESNANHLIVTVSALEA